MKFADDARPKWLELYSRAQYDPYQKVMDAVEFVATSFEKSDDHTFPQYGVFLSAYEARKGFRLSVQDIGEVFVLLGNYWAEGEKFIESIGFLEQKLVVENVEYRLSVLAKDAQEKGKDS